MVTGLATILAATLIITGVIYLLTKPNAKPEVEESEEGKIVVEKSESTTDETDQHTAEKKLEDEYTGIHEPDYIPPLADGVIVLINNKPDLPLEFMDNDGIMGLNQMFSTGLINAGYDAEKVYNADIDLNSLNQLYDTAGLMFSVRETDDNFVFFYNMENRGYFIEKIDLDSYRIDDEYIVGDAFKDCGGDVRFNKAFFCAALNQLPEYTEFYVTENKVENTPYETRFDVQTYDNLHRITCRYDKTDKGWGFDFQEIDPNAPVYEVNPPATPVKADEDEGDDSDTEESESGIVVTEVLE